MSSLGDMSAPDLRRRGLAGRNHVSSSRIRADADDDGRPEPSTVTLDSCVKAIFATLVVCFVAIALLFVFYRTRSASLVTPDRPQTDPIYAKVSVPFPMAFTGGVLSVAMEDRVTICKSCAGSGAAPGAIHFCSTCQGTGERVSRAQMFAGGPVIHIRQRCDQCSGVGKIITRRCSKCRGQRVLHRPAKIDIQVPSGTQSGDVVRLHGEGNHMPNEAPGDLIVTFGVPTEFEHFKRIGSNVTMLVAITLRESLLGFHKSIRHIDNAVLDLDRTGQITKPDTIVTYKGIGWPQTRDGSPSGNLNVHFDIEFPSSLRVQDIQTLKQTF